MNRPPLEFLPPIRGHLAALGRLFPGTDVRQLINHDSMRVYYDISWDGDGNVSFSDLPTTAARAALILPVIERLVAQHGQDISILDLACSPGYFMFKLAQRGLKNITGVDARQDHHDQFRMLNSYYQYAGIKHVHSDIYQFLDAEALAGRQYDVCLLFGFLYHTATPVELLNKIRLICRSCLVIDTTVSRRNDVSLLVYEEATDWSRASTTRISLMPSMRAVPKLLEAASYGHVERILPAPEYAALNPGGDKVDYYFDRREPMTPGGRIGSIWSAVKRRLRPDSVAVNKAGWRVLYTARID